MRFTPRGMRRVRIVFSLLVFLLLSAQFLDIFHRLPESWYTYHPTKTQFIPSLLNFLGGGGVLAGAAFLTFTVTTLLFGRVYCSFFCPLGIG
ncbi:MAG TPA: 4Fe-4S binding protein, partial [Verrucomicrobiota bacterium]|nr:4Fe-4S binding protein [Verrucomicrobiota bacterium]